MKLFSPPVFGDESETLAARKLWAVLIGFFATVTPLFLFACLAIPASSGRFLGYALLYNCLFLSQLILARTGRSRLAAILLIGFVVALVTYAAWTAGGVRSPGMMAYLLLVGVAGILLGPLVAAMVAAACIVASSLLLLAERAGRLPTPTIRHTATSTWLVLVFLLAELVVVQWVVGWVVRRAEKQARASAAEREKAEKRERQAREEFAGRLIASQEAERGRIAGELHDSLGQELILIKNRVQLALNSAASPSDLRAQLQRLHEMAAQAIAELRQISRDLRPHHLDQLGLTRALETVIGAAAQSSNLAIERKLDSVDDLFPPERAIHLYRVVQESLSNILKHAQARSVRIGLERGLRHVRLWIEDDGRGLPVAPGGSDPPAGGLGLGSMAERVRILGGTFGIASGSDRGTRIEIEIPTPRSG
jgi:signal transduction histidine kinase